MMNTSTNAQWQQRIENYCEAWTTYDGKPDFDRIGEYYAHDPDVIIYDTLPPLEGFTGFEALRAIYPNLERLVVTPNKDVRVRLLAGGTVAITTHTFRLAHTPKGGAKFEVDARQSNVWEKRDGKWLIVHEHPSTVVQTKASETGK